MQLFMSHHKLRVADASSRSNGLMHRSLPTKAHPRAQNPLPVIGESGLAMRVKGHVIRRHDHVKVIQAFLLEAHQDSGVLHHVIGVQPHQKITARMGKGFVARGGKIILPGEVIYVRRIAQGDLAGFIP